MRAEETWQGDRRSPARNGDTNRRGRTPIDLPRAGLILDAIDPTSRIYRFLVRSKYLILTDAAEEEATRRPRPGFEILDSDRSSSQKSRSSPGHFHPKSRLPSSKVRGWFHVGSVQPRRSPEFGSVRGKWGGRPRKSGGARVLPCSSLRFGEGAIHLGRAEAVRGGKAHRKWGGPVRAGEVSRTNQSTREGIRDGGRTPSSSRPRHVYLVYDTSRGFSEGPTGRGTRLFWRDTARKRSTCFPSGILSAMPPGSKLCIRNVPCRKTSQSGWKQSSSCMQARGMGKLPTAQKRCHHGLGAAEETTENVVMWRRISKLGHQHESRDIHVLKTPFFETVKETLSLTDCQQVPFEFTFVWQELNRNQRCLRFCHGTSIKIPLAPCFSV